MLDGEEEYTLIPILMEVVRYQDQNSNLVSLELNNIFGYSMYAQGGAIRDCFLDTTGIAAGVALVAALVAEVVNKKLVKKLIKQAVKKIGGRVLGGIGLALLIIDFSYCVATYEYTEHFAPTPQ